MPEHPSNLKGSRFFPKIKPLQQSVGGWGGMGLESGRHFSSPAGSCQLNIETVLCGLLGVVVGRNAPSFGGTRAISDYNQSIHKYLLNAYFGSRDSLSETRFRLSKNASKGSTKSW